MFTSRVRTVGTLGNNRKTNTGRKDLDGKTIWSENGREFVIRDGMKTAPRHASGTGAHAAGGHAAGGHVHTQPARRSTPSTPSTSSARLTTLTNLPSHLIASHIAPHLSTRTAARLDIAASGRHRIHGLARETRHGHETRSSSSSGHVSTAISKFAERLAIVMKKQMERAHSNAPPAIKFRSTTLTFGGMKVEVGATDEDENDIVTFYFTKHVPPSGRGRIFDERQIAHGVWDPHEQSVELCLQADQLAHEFGHAGTRGQVAARATNGLIAAIIKETIRRGTGKPVVAVHQQAPWWIEGHDEHEHGRRQTQHPGHVIMYQGCAPDDENQPVGFHQILPAGHHHH